MKCKILFKNVADNGIFPVPLQYKDGNVFYDMKYIISPEKFNLVKKYEPKILELCKEMEKNEKDEVILEYE